MYPQFILLIPFLYIEGTANNITRSMDDVDELSISSPDQTYVADTPYKVDGHQMNNDSLNSSNRDLLTTIPGRVGHRRRSRGPRSTDFLKHLDEIVMPVAICIGIIGNLLLIPVFTLTPLKANSLSHYLAAVGVSDLLYLVSCLIAWTNQREINLYDTIGVCQITSFILRLSQFLATWYLFAAHVERFLVHFGSFQTIAWCSTFRTKFIILFIFVFSLVGFLHYIWTHIVTEFHGQDRCMIMQESIKHIIRLGKIEVFAALFIPMLFFVLIDIALCINIIVKRYLLYFRVTSKNAPVKNEVGQDELGEYVLAPRHRSASTSNRSRDSSLPSPEFNLSLEKRSATIAVIASGLIFIGLILPSSIYRARLSFASNRGYTQQDRITMTIFEHLVKFNSVYKFILYFIFLRTFRTGLVHLFKCRKCKKERKSGENSVQETTEV